MTEEEFDHRYERAANLDDYEAAIAVCEDFSQTNPASSLGHWKKALVYSKQGSFTRAVESLNPAILMEPKEARFFFFRGWWNYEAGNFEAAELDQTKVLELEASSQSSYFLESALFFRSLARLRLSRFEAALQDAKDVSEDFFIYLVRDGAISISDIKKEAQARMAG
jgi:tetratricopeptide (TPR) repeat protein